MPKMTKPQLEEVVRDICNESGLSNLAIADMLGSLSDEFQMLADASDLTVMRVFSSPAMPSQKYELVSLVIRLRSPLG